MLVYLILAGLIINGTHLYLLWSQKDDRKWSISEHAARNSITYLLYVVGHIVGGFIFLVFAHQFYVEKFGIAWLFFICCFTYFFEVLQALLPAKGKTNIPHTIAAYIMWLSFLSAGILSLIYLPLTTTVNNICWLIMGLILAQLVYIHFRRDKLYFYQVTMVVMFYAIMAILTITSS
jgi:hypothetical protein